MARAIEVVEWMKAYSNQRAAECASCHPLTAEVFRNNAMAYDAVINALRQER